MKDRINKLIQRENITPSKFADIIGVQRSSVSHILSGRNNPGLDFLFKVLQHFPHISGDWLITGQGAMVKLTSGGKIPSLFEDNSPDNTLTPKASDGIKVNKPIIAPIKEQQGPLLTPEIVETPKQQPLAVTIRTVEKIVVFYSDNSFKEYLPESK